MVFIQTFTQFIIHFRSDSDSDTSSSDSCDRDRDEDTSDKDPNCDSNDFVCSCKSWRQSVFFLGFLKASLLVLNSFLSKPQFF